MSLGHTLKLWLVKVHNSRGQSYLYLISKKLQCFLALFVTSLGFVSILSFDRVYFPGFGSSPLQPCESITEHFLMASNFPHKQISISRQRQPHEQKHRLRFHDRLRGARSANTSKNSALSDLKTKPHLTTTVRMLEGMCWQYTMTWAERVPERFNISHGGSGVSL